MNWDNVKHDEARVYQRAYGEPASVFINAVRDALGLGPLKGTGQRDAPAVYPECPDPFDRYLNS